MFCFGVLATLGAQCSLTMLKTVTSLYAAFGLMIPALAIVSFYTSTSGLIKTEMFPAEVRALGVGLSYVLACHRTLRGYADRVVPDAGPWQEKLSGQRALSSTYQLLLHQPR